MRCTPSKPSASSTTARACALVYNGWSWSCRTAHPTARMAAITNLPLLRSAVGRAAPSGGQTTLYLTPRHGKASLLKPLISNIQADLRHVGGERLLVPP
jgi:hypothetical protein